jgi:hypothetical protein
MKLASADSETHRFRNGLRAPPVVCSSSSVFLVDGKIKGVLEIGPAAFVARLRWLAARGYYIAFANAAYDLCVAAAYDPSILPLIFELLAQGRIVDVLITESLHAIYGGHLGLTPNGTELRRPSTGEVTTKYSLDVVLHLVCRRIDAKVNDVFRESYALLDGIPAERWPIEAQTYPVNDSDNTLDVAGRQIVGVEGAHAWVDVPPLPGVALSTPTTVCRYCDEELSFSNSDLCTKAPRYQRKNLYNMPAQVAADFALQLGNAHSLRTDPEKIAKLSEEVEAKHAAAVERFQKKGWVRTGKHLWRPHGGGFRCNRCATWSKDAEDSRCKEHDEDGSEDQSAVKKAIALAYGASKPCARCAGTGKVKKIEQVECRGVKIKNRFQGCLGPHCLTCAGLRVLQKEAGEKTCKNVFDEDDRLVEIGCDGTGFDLDSVPLLPRADKLGVKTDRDAKMESGDEDMADYGEDEIEKTRTTYIPFLLTGVDAPLDLKPNVLVASGRCSYGTIHQFPREGGPRGCIRARGRWCGYPVEMVLGSTDYAAGELCTLSSYCYYLFRYSEMMQAINRSGDPGILHSDLASEVLGISLEEFLVRLKAKDKQAVNFRQAMKPINFGVPGGMGVPKLVYTNRKKSVGFTVCERGPAVNRKGEPGYWGARFCVLTGGATQCGLKKITKWKGYDCPPVCEACCAVVETMLKPAYFRRYPEVKDYHKWCSKWIEAGKPMPCLLWDAEAQKARIVRERGGCDFPAFANNGFQSMLADIGKHAFVNMTRECYLGIKPDGSSSPLAGCRLPVYLHDEPLSELFLETAHESGPRIAEIMMEAGRLLAPFVTWKAETALSFWWDKGMESIYEEYEFVDELAKMREKRKKLVPWGEVPEEHQWRYERTRRKAA